MENIAQDSKYMNIKREEMDGFLILTCHKNSEEFTAKLQCICIGCMSRRTNTLVMFIGK